MADQHPTREVRLRLDSALLDRVDAVCDERLLGRARLIEQLITRGLDRLDRPAQGYEVRRWDGQVVLTAEGDSPPLSDLTCGPRDGVPCTQPDRCQRAGGCALYDDPSRSRTLYVERSTAVLAGPAGTGPAYREGETMEHAGKQWRAGPTVLREGGGWETMLVATDVTAALDLDVGLRGCVDGGHLDPGERPWPIGWEDECDGAGCPCSGLGHQWERVIVHPPGVHPGEPVVRCRTCHVPRCGGAGDVDPCMIQRHHPFAHAPMSTHCPDWPNVWTSWD